MLVLDADALIKLYKAGVLAQVAGAFECVMPRRVYDEVVTIGRERNYPDADPIDRIISDGITVRDIDFPEQSVEGLDSGEMAILALLTYVPTISSRPLIVSDDGTFLSYLAMMDLPRIAPALLIVEMAKQGVLTRESAMESMELLRPYIRYEHYNEAMIDLENPINPEDLK